MSDTSTNLSKIKREYKFNTSVISDDNSEYKETLKNMVKNLTFSKGEKEENVRKTVEEVIKAGLRQSKICDSKNEFELVKMFNSERKVTVKSRQIGFIDSDFKNILIEYKRYEKLDDEENRKKAIEQLKDYMLSPEMSACPLIYGFLTDGKSIYVMKKEKNAIENIDNFSGLINEFKLDYFIRCLVNFENKEISANSIRDDFAIINNENNKITLNLFLELLKIKQSSTSERTTLLFTEWEKLFKLSESDNSIGEEVAKRRNSLSRIVKRDVKDATDEYNIIFAIHTVYSLIIKLIALKASKENSATIHIDFNEMGHYDNVKLNNFLHSIETGKIFKSMNILNMIEGDFFSWYLAENLTDDFYSNFRELCLKLSNYETFEIKMLYKTQDFFRELYECCVPPEIRHSFGEFYTPYWLADGVILDYIERNKITDIYRSLDPTCGSGTFVMANMDKIINYLNSKHNSLTNKEKTEIILNNCYGIDLNPLAVLSSKINYYMNIANIYDGSYEIEIPIYLGDSSYMPHIENLDGVKCISYDFYTDIDKSNNFIHFCLPLDFINDRHFITTMDELECIITSKGKPDKDKITESMNLITPKIDDKDKNDKVIAEIKLLLEKLIELESKKLNSIWLRIFANYLKSSALDKMDLISGNPPWVDWKNLPDKYCEKLKLSCKKTGIFSNDKNVGGISLNICALIAMKCCDKYLKDDGELSFLMPDGIMYNKSFEGFRNFNIDNTKYYFKKIVDWSKAGKPFDPVTVNFCCFTVSKSESDYIKGIPYQKYSVKRGMSLTDTHAVFATEKDKLNIEDKFAFMISTKSNNPFTILDNPIPNIDKIVGEKQYKFRKGLGLKTEVHKLIYAGECPSDDKLAYFYTFEKGNKYKKVSKNKVLLEKAYVRPLIETPCLTYYELNWKDEYVCFPYEWGNKKPIPYEKLKKIAPYLAKHLNNNRKILEEQSEYNKRVQNSSEFYGIIRTGDYMFNPNFVCIKDNSELIATPVTTVTTHWGEEVVPVFDGHVSYISETLAENKISENEMYFLVGILNCPSVKKYIEASSSSQSIGTKFDVYLPQFDETNQIHIKIVNLAKQIKPLVNKKNQILSDIDKIKETLTSKELKAIRDYKENKISKLEDETLQNKIDNVSEITKEIGIKSNLIQDLYITIKP